MARKHWNRYFRTKFKCIWKDEIAVSLVLATVLRNPRFAIGCHQNKWNYIMRNLVTAVTKDFTAYFPKAINGNYEYVEGVIILSHFLKEQSSVKVILANFMRPSAPSGIYINRHLTQTDSVIAEPEIPTPLMLKASIRHGPESVPSTSDPHNIRSYSEPNQGNRNRTCIPFQ